MIYMKINWKVRVNNPLWWAQIGLSVLTPILSYAGLTAADVTTWAALGDLLLGAISNPYVLVLVGISVWNACNDPTTGGLSDSEEALTYTTPKG
jgi:phi LC3 family holin